MLVIPAPHACALWHIVGYCAAACTYHRCCNQAEHVGCLDADRSASSPHRGAPPCIHNYILVGFLTQSPTHEETRHTSVRKCERHERLQK